MTIRLPKKFRFTAIGGRSVRSGAEVDREQKGSPTEAFRLLGSLPADFMEEGRKDDPPQKRDV